MVKKIAIFSNSLSLGVVTVFILLLSLHLHQKWRLNLGHVGITLADIAIAVLGLAWIISSSRSVRIRDKRYLFIAIIIVLIFNFWIGIEALRSPQPMRGLTMFFMSIRDFAIVLVVGTSLKGDKDLKNLNKLVFLLGVGIALVSLSLYMNALRNYQIILANEGLWNPNTIYEIGERRVLRLEGFAGDSNFFALFLSLSFFCGLTITNSMGRLVKWVGLLILGVALFLTYSRSLLLSYLISIIFIATIGILFRKPTWRRYAILAFLPVILGFGVIMIKLPSTNTANTAVDWMRYRLERPQHRFKSWQKVIVMIPNRPLIGYGLRAGEETLGRYTHNSYIDLLLETGLVGLFLFLIFAVIVLKNSIIQFSRTFYMGPWFHSWLVCLLMFFNFSLLYNPFSWIVAGVILAQSDSQSKGNNRYSMVPKLLNVNSD